MRVLIVTQYFWPENFRINQIVESLVDRGVDVEVLTGKPNYPEGKIFQGYRTCGCQTEQWKGALVHRVPLIPRGRNSAFGLLSNYISFIFFGLVSGSWLLRKRQYDVIFVYGLSPILLAIPGLLLGWLKNINVIIWIQDLWPESLSATGFVRNNIIISAVRQVVSWIYRSADLLLVQSRAFDKPVRALTAKTPIIYYPNSVDDSFTTIAKSLPPDVPGLGDGFSVMFAGNIGVAQGVSVIVEAALLLKGYADIHFVVLGDGSSREWMLKESRQHGLTNLHLPGRFPMETMPAFMQKASALLVTLADQAIFAVTVPNKVQAYLATGRPIIACLNGEGARLVVEAEAGLACPAGDARALADAVLYLYKLSPNEREIIGVNGRRYYQKHFNHEYLVDELIGHLRAMSKHRKDFA